MTPGGVALAGSITWVEFDGTSSHSKRFGMVALIWRSEINLNVFDVHHCPLLIRLSILLRRAASPSAPKPAVRMPIALCAAFRLDPTEFVCNRVVMLEDLTPSSGLSQ